MAKWRAQDNKPQITAASQGKQRKASVYSTLSRSSATFFNLCFREADGDPAWGVQSWKEEVDGFAGTLFTTLLFCAGGAWDWIEVESCVIEYEDKVFCLRVCTQE